MALPIPDDWGNSRDHSQWTRNVHQAIERIEHHVSEVITSLRLAGRPLVAEAACIHPTAIVGENVVVGESATVGPYCYVRDNVVIDDGVYLGYNVEVSNSVILAETQIHHAAFIGNSIVGRECNLGSWFVTSTRRLGETTAGSTRIGAERLVSSRRHHGCAIGDAVEVGVHVCTMPGATIGHSCLVFPASVVSGELVPGSRGFFLPTWAAETPSETR